ncbi:hypothetical protein ASE63_02510 [Bosea sp. Root381]|uniref:tetratricopeptide repeat protein n=1 Tax=Bosea sp. Root381 TaxID=1736524 RepID=UPI0007147CED|nr:hypothetical protein [Bosea sp. Root381]KRE18075.1 hypothetical protein ASE63_02510 [Bosea sp. Root381]
MVEGDALPERPGDGFPTHIRAGLARVLASDAFRAAPQLSAFLGFVVESALEGRGAELKGYTIAVEAFGRSADFDPQSDPIVRVEAGRLRRALAQYYAGEGADDPVRISMPVGAYIPVFDLAGAAPGAGEDRAEPAAEAAAAPLSEPAGDVAPVPARPRFTGAWKRWSVLLGVGFCAVLAFAAAWHFGWPAATPRHQAASVLAAGSEPPAPRQAVPGAPLQVTVVAVLLPELSADPKLGALAQRFSRFLVDALTRFDDLLTVKAPPAGEAAPADADYVFEMTAQAIDGTLESFGRLRSVRDGRIVWSSSSSRALSAEDGDLPELARRVAIRLAEPFGIIHADIRQYAQPGTMRCLYQAIDVRRTLKPEDHLAARKCLEELVDRDPTFFPAWVQLAFLALGEYSSGLNPLPGPPLDRALAAALTAVRLAPSSGRAQQVMMDVLFARGATEEAIKAGQSALVLNPYDSDIKAALGARYIQINRPAEGLQLMQRAIELSAGRPPAYDFYALLGAYLLGDKQVSQSYGAFLAAGDDVYALLGRALLAAQAGNEAEKAEAVMALGKNFPLFAIDPRLWMMRRGFRPEVVDRLVADIALAPP